MRNAVEQQKDQMNLPFLAQKLKGSGPIYPDNFVDR